MEHKKSLSLSYGGASLTGKRQENQDAFVVRHPEEKSEQELKGTIACIADGVSCSSHGQKASHTSVMQFVSDYYATPDSWSVQHCASQVLKSLNAWLYESGAKEALRHNGLVTTFSSAIFKSNTAHIFHVGDSRVYLFRAGGLRLLTRDHQRINGGKNAYLTRALGMDTALEVDYQTIELHTGDQFLFTTDGVHDVLDDSALCKVMQEAQSASGFATDLEHQANQLCQQAIKAGGQDNATCLFVSVEALPQLTFLEFQQQTLNRVLPPALKVNNRIDDYRVTRVIHSGSRSHVYEVIEEATEQRYVLKAPSQHYADDTDTLVFFSNEYWVGSRVNNHRIMKIYPHTESSPYLYHLCEWIDGITLRQWMYDNPQPTLQQVRTIIDELIKAVRVLQRLDMVHRDLKPENVMISADGTIKIIDLGAVSVKGLEESQPKQSVENPLGAANYIAPEYLSGEPATTVSDLFSVGVISYEMLCGVLPYKEVTALSVQQARHQKWQYRSMAELREDVPLWFELAIQKACHPQATSRYQVLGEFVTDITLPNAALLKAVESRPLMKKSPVLFWKGIAVLFALIAFVEFLILIKD
ncbi:bifunctional protein-serine/threonine kinase/phosphatase [Vibrio sp. ZSDZ65]|uniref:Bifunctional protein-serine/threonine kinase/phosphatase n=1 Tax=Vibrio qingdaonensis TaxID=2829491 RepID=A0A9X3HWI7_9VIBR|nr:bifunctional protein-serine/threonine kinase/phosphatase [Vibrio qingdaonensis]MCW8346685.1 bifunctional protein-serine/threonine kinase/phosphatase [Vibrio qingdaonensis]